MNAIRSFQGPYRFLSNFWPASISYEGIVYPSVEHAYQAAKTYDVATRSRIAALATPAEAKRAGRHVKMDRIFHRIGIMGDLVHLKFATHPELAAQLLATGDALLEEGNAWNDTFWGVCNNVGANHLGTILMAERAALAAEKG